MKRVAFCAVASGLLSLATAADLSVSAQSGAEGLFAAIEKARTIPGPVTVRIEPGVYVLERTILLGAEDSNLTLAAESGCGGNVVFSGGRKVVGWQDEGGGVWSASVPWVTTERDTSFRILSVGGVKRPRARLPKKGYFTVVNDNLPEGTKYNVRRPAFFYDPKEFDAGWKGLESAEIIAFSFWCDNHLRIAAVDPSTNLVTFVTPSGKAFDTGWTNNKRGGKRGRYVIENFASAMTEPGEWYCDFAAKRVYYRPLAGERLEGFVAEVPFVRELVRIEASPKRDARFVENIVLRGISFTLSQFEHGVKDTNDDQASQRVASAVTLAGARNCRFENCRFSMLSGYALTFGAGTFDNAVLDCVMTDLGGGGVRMDGGGFNSHRLDECSGNVVGNCEIGHYGREFRSSVGVLLKHTEKCRVDHCHIFDGYYTGVSVGWSWGYGHTNCRLNEITCNHIHDIGQRVLSDMGGIYLLGKSYGTKVSGNRIHNVDSDAYGGWGIYCDEGTTGVLIENNVVYDTLFATFNIHYCREVTVRNNIFACGKKAQITRTRVEPHLSCFFAGNIVYWDEGPLLTGNWNDGDQKKGSTYFMDGNCFFNPNFSVTNAVFAGQTLDCRRKVLGRDISSIWADPQFSDAGRRDFRLRPGSPVFALGFTDFDQSDVGPRKKGVR